MVAAKIAARSWPRRAELSGDEGDADQRADHAEPLDEIRQPIAAMQHLQIRDRELGPRIEIELASVVRRVDGHAAVLDPVNNPSHMVGH